MHNVVVVNEKRYHYGQVSAEEQLDLYQEIGARLLSTCVSAQKDKIDVGILHGMLISAPKGTITHIADIVLTKCVEEGKKEHVTIKDFQGDINNYVRLVCHGLIVNLADFFTFIENQVKELKEQAKNQEQAL